ncbi:polysaccharide deacetylase [Coprobacillus sp. CAG:826]|nr:polysaccharide deacetylase family protein [Coprobacillus sp.]CDD92796.1 polysaccharide deacetylase [Coprobacillus sp. CAG:826]
MYKHVAFFLLLPLLFACSPSSPTTSSNSNSDTASTIVLSTSSNTPLSSTSTMDEDVWDVSNVDVSHIDPENRLICLTFDDGPIPYYENKILDVFENFNKEYGKDGFTAHGTFFYKGTNVKEENKETMLRALESGFQIGNHTENHVHLENLKAREIKSEVKTALDKLNDLLGINDALVRLPFGTYSNTVLETVNYPMINWTNGLDTLDWSGKTASEIQETVMNHLGDGSIVLMHEGFEPTIQALKNLLPLLYERGYQVVTINEYAKVRGISLKRHQVYTTLAED